MKEKKYNKLLIIIIIGIFISATAVYATTTYLGNAIDLTYDNNNSGLTSTNVQDALEELYKKCPEGYLCVDKPPVKLGDYVSLTPTKSSYTTDTSKTGNTRTQTINPQELNLWRVISINNDGTVDIISEHVSSVDVIFSGQTGYLNFVGYLNVLASQYENSTYTTGSRHFGYNGQTEYITDTSKFTNPAPWTCSTGESCNPTESQGGGDKLYQKDYDLVNTVLGTRVATNPSGTSTEYWMASRVYRYKSQALYGWLARFVNANVSVSSNYDLYDYDESSFHNYICGWAVRPILTLKSRLKYTGDGTESSPWQLEPLAELGDYVSLTPTKSSYTTDTSMTGYTSTQTINPQELNLWRVISLNDDGTVDIISEHVSSVSVYFSGQTGYQNLVGYLNVLASKYENSTYTTGSRHFGYNGQTEYITDTSKFTNPAPWTCSTGESCNPTESQGGGDELYTKDYDLVNTVLGTSAATNPSGTASTYWMASRDYYFDSLTSYDWRARGVDTSGSNRYAHLYYYNSSSFDTRSLRATLRPVLTLKSGLKYSGAGTESSPRQLSVR